jgi:uncharacterized membrane protein
VGTAVIEYTATDGVATDSATLYLTTLTFNDTQADNDINQTPMNVTVGGNVLTNDSDAQGNSQTVTGALVATGADGVVNDPLVIGVSTPIFGTNDAGAIVAAGSLTLNANGTYTYVPASGFLGTVPAVYTITDKASVAAWLIPPLVYDWGCNFFRSLVLVPLTQRRWPGSIGAAWRERRKTVVAIALLSPLSYILVLTALVFTPVSLVAPAREVSILFAALLGAHFLKEGDLVRRLVAAVGMALGVAGLVTG